MEEQALQTRQEWLQQALERYETRQAKLREKHWNRFGSNSKAARDDCAFRDELDKLLRGDLFQRIKHRYVESKEASDETALVSLLAVDYCAGSTEFVLCETPSEHPEKYLDERTPQPMALDELCSLLREHNLVFERWLKPVSTLWDELQSGQSVLRVENAALCRHVEQVRVHCLYQHKERGLLELYKESRHIADNLTIKPRDSECLRKRIACNSLTPIEIAENTIRRDLGLYPIDATRQLTASKVETHPFVSESYAGLKTQFTTYPFVFTLTEEQFRESYVKRKPGHFTVFAWREVEK